MNTRSLIAVNLTPRKHAWVVNEIHFSLHNLALGDKLALAATLLSIPMSQIFLAFQKGQRRKCEWLTRFITRSRYSHVEIFTSRGNPRPGATYTFISSDSWSDSVRACAEVLDPNLWDVLPVPWAPVDAWDRARALLGSAYDKRALILTHFLNLRLKDEGKFICTEVCGEAIGLTEAFKYSPGELFTIVSDINRVFDARLEATRSTSSVAPPKRAVIRPSAPALASLEQMDTAPNRRRGSRTKLAEVEAAPQRA